MCLDDEDDNNSLDDEMTEEEIDAQNEDIDYYNSTQNDQ